MPKKATPSVAEFEQSLKKLESIIETMEQNPEQSLDGTLENFEQGMKLVKTCHQQLDQAEQRVSTLIEETQQTEDAAD